MIYPKKINANRGEMITKIAIISSVLVAIILIIINKLTTPQIHWAAIANSGIIYIWIVVIYSVNKNVNIYSNNHNSSKLSNANTYNSKP